MRIRSIKPEFWRSEDIAKLDWHDRLLFIGLWSYVDDNGVGRDNAAIITAELFALDGEFSEDSLNPHDILSESSVRVQTGLSRLHNAGLIERYRANSKRYLHVKTWERHQKINRPSPGRYPLPDDNSVEIHDILSESSVSPHNILSAGTEDQGIRGSGEKDSCSSVAADATPSERESLDVDLDRWQGQARERTRVRDQQTYAEFAEWWQRYPRKVGKGHAMKAYRAARRKTDHATLVAAIDAQADRLMAKGSEFCPHPATWLNGERWADETTPPPIDDAPDESWISKPAPDWMYDAELVEKLIEEASGG